MTTELSAAKPKLLVILPADTIGGAETRTYNLLKGLHRFECVLLTQSSIADYYLELGIRICRFDQWDCISPYLMSFRNILRYSWAIRSVVRSEKPDLILSLMHNGTLFSAVARRLFFRDVPLIGTVLGHVSGYFASLGRMPSPMERWIIHCCVSQPTCVIVPSYGVFEDLVSCYGAVGDRFRVIYNGIDIDSVRRKAGRPSDLELNKDCPWIVSASRLSIQKDYPTLLKAFKSVLGQRRARLILVGEGELRQNIEKFALELGILGDLTLVGFQENPFPYIARGDIFVLSSFYEGFGNVIVEAMALGVPVVATDCPAGPGEIIADGKNGFLVPVGDAVALADRCLVLLADTQRRSALARAGLERADQFSVDKMVAAFDDCLSGILGDS